MPPSIPRIDSISLAHVVCFSPLSCMLPKNKGRLKQKKRIYSNAIVIALSWTTNHYSKLAKSRGESTPYSLASILTSRNSYLHLSAVNPCQEGNWGPLIQPMSRFNQLTLKHRIQSSIPHSSNFTAPSGLAFNPIRTSSESSFKAVRNCST